MFIIYVLGDDIGEKLGDHRNADYFLDTLPKALSIFKKRLYKLFIIKIKNFWFGSR